MKRYLQKVIFCKTGEGAIPEIPESMETGVLYITDHEQCLRSLKGRGLPAAAWLHEDNRQQDLSAATYGVEHPEELDTDFYERIYRREMGIPWDILETEHCLVREMIPEDAESFCRIYQEPVINKYMKDFHKNAEGEAQYIREYQQKYHFFEYGVWTVVLKETGEVIGRAGFSERDEEVLFDGENAADLPADIPRLGYMIGVPWQRKGYAYEVCQGILEYAREELGFEKVILIAEADNIPSLKLAEKLMFQDVEKGSKVHNDSADRGCQVIWKVLSLR